MPITNFQPRFYGRRLGRPLSQHQRHILNDVMPQYVLDVAQLPPSPWALEIGFGRGEHLLAQAVQHPQRLFIGAEAFLTGVIAIIGEMVKHNLENIRLWPQDVRQLLTILPPQCLSEVTILFPDPWPKERHHRRRLISEDFINIVCPLLVAGAVLKFASDHDQYAQEVIALLAQDKRFLGGLIERPDVETWPSTRYERKALAQGKSSAYCVYTYIGVCDEAVVY
jgi:tRNA (guanine-N7-)-methyltransferase